MQNTTMLLLCLFLLSSVACDILKEPFCSSEVCLPVNYNRMDLPNTTGPLVVKTTILLKDIFEVHPKTFTLDLSLYVKLEWVDNRINLTRDGSFSVDKTFLSSIWKPDLFIWDLNGEQSYSDKITMSSVTLERKSGSKDSSVIYVLELDVNIVCAMNFSLFPFDSSQCKFRISAFTFDDSKVLILPFPSLIITLKVLFVSNNSQSPDSHLMLSKIRNYDLHLSYLPPGVNIFLSRIKTEEMGGNNVFRGDKGSFLGNPRHLLLNCWGGSPATYTMHYNVYYTYTISILLGLQMHVLCKRGIIRVFSFLFALAGENDLDNSSWKISLGLLCPHNTLHSLLMVGSCFSSHFLKGFHFSSLRHLILLARPFLSQCSSVR